MKLKSEVLLKDKELTERKPNIGVVSTFGVDLLSDLIDVQSSLAADIHVIAPGLRQEEQQAVFFYPIKYEVGDNVFAQVVNQIITQFKMSYRVARLAGKVDFWVFFGCDVFLLPVLTARLLNSRVMLTLLGNLEKETALKKNALNRVQIIMKKMNCALSDRIIVYSERLAREWQLERYKAKILVAESQYIDLNEFRIEKTLGERDSVVGFIGRLSSEKGILNLLRAVPLVLEKDPRIRFVIIGDGSLYSEAVEYVAGTDLQNKVTFVGRVPHSEIPQYLNEFRLYVLPSYSEGMAGTVLEAMACGAPVLTTPVGAIPDVIADGETGFIMENNSPQCIAENIIRVLQYPDSDEVVISARKLVEGQFSLEAARKKYQRVMTEAMTL